MIVSVHQDLELLIRLCNLV